MTCPTSSSFSSLAAPILFNRANTAHKVLDALSQVRPEILFVIVDGLWASVE